MKINLGSGGVKIDGYVNVDYDHHTNPDYIVDVERDRFPFEDNTVETVVAHHILEHLGEGFFHCLQELYRVCKHGAIIDIRVPHYKHWTFAADPTHRRPILPEGLRLFSKKANDADRDNANSKLGHFFNVDFEIVSNVEVPDPNYLHAFNGMRQEEAQRYISEHNNIVMEIHIRMVVIKDYEQNT